MNKSCFFIGHRNTPESVRPFLRDAIRKHITEYGVTEFYVGHYGMFDGMVASTLSEMKNLYPNIKAYLLLAYHPAVRQIDIPQGFDGSVLMEDQEKLPPRYAITNLNKRMVREADYLIAYVEHITDGSYNLLNYATKREKKGLLVISNLYKGG